MYLLMEMAEGEIGERDADQWRLNGDKPPLCLFYIQLFPLPRK